MRARARLLGLAALLAALAIPTPAGATPRASLPQIEREVMCVVCGVPLNIAESQQADRERAFISGLIGQGDDERQIKRELIGQYGPAVLATPSHRGFGLVAYLVPVVLGLALMIALALLLPRWRQRAGGGAGGGAATASAPALSAPETAHLDADMARFEG